ncbi:unnamed protein product [Mortierella alpina]
MLQEQQRQMMQGKQDRERQINLLRLDLQQHFEQLQYFFQQQQLGFQQIMYSTRPAFTPSPSYQLPHLYPAPQPHYVTRPLKDAHQHQGCHPSRQMHEFARPSVSVTPPTVQQRPPGLQNVADQPTTAVSSPTGTSTEPLEGTDQRTQHGSGRQMTADSVKRGDFPFGFCFRYRPKNATDIWEEQKSYPNCKEHMRQKKNAPTTSAPHNEAAQQQEIGKSSYIDGVQLLTNWSSIASIKLRLETRGEQEAEAETRARAKLEMMVVIATVAVASPDNRIVDNETARPFSRASTRSRLTQEFIDGKRGA